jgi:hypothetical protein
MPRRITKYQPTPNPNALKCFLDAPLAGGARSFRSAAEAAEEPADSLAAAIFALPGVAGLLLSGEWLTVNKAPEADWGPIKKGLERALGMVE